MNRYELNAYEMAVLFVAISECRSLLQHSRSSEEIRTFAEKYYGLLHMINYEIIGERLTEEIHIELSRSDEKLDLMSLEDRIDYLKNIFINL